MQPPTILRVPTMSAEEKVLVSKRKNMLLALQLHRERLQEGKTPRKVELDLFLKSANNAMLYVEACTEYLFFLEGHEVAVNATPHKEEVNVSSMFEAEAKINTDSRNALSRCGKCKSTNVRNTARQVRSAGKYRTHAFPSFFVVVFVLFTNPHCFNYTQDEGMSVFSTCLDCGHTWVQR